MRVRQAHRHSDAGAHTQSHALNTPETKIYEPEIVERINIITKQMHLVACEHVFRSGFVGANRMCACFSTSALIFHSAYCVQ